MLSVTLVFAWIWLFNLFHVTIIAVLKWYFARRKRAADDGDDSLSTTNPVVGTYIQDDLITSPDSAGQPPDSPLHQHAVFPTPSGITEQMANDMCRAAIQQTPLYYQCLNYTAVDTEHYILSGVEDIKVTLWMCVICLVHLRSVNIYLSDIRLHYNIQLYSNSLANSSAASNLPACY